MASILDGNENIFLTGQAGTGKTYLLRQFIEDHKGEILVAASTGTAAADLEAVTVHRLFSIPVPAYGGDPYKVKLYQLEIFKHANIVVIDEVSMLRNDAFSFAIKVLRRAERTFGHKIRLVVSGDFSQLPPVVNRNDRKFLEQFGFDPSGFAFTTKEWKNCKFKTIELTDIKRQTDQEYIEKLGQIRNGNENAVDYFNQFVTTQIPEDAIRICGTNREASEINTRYLNSLPGKTYTYFSETQGTVGKDHACEDELKLKIGARIMFIANDSILDSNGNFNADFGDLNSTGRYTNGQFATVTDLGKGYVKVKIDDGGTIDVDLHKWSTYKYFIQPGTMLLEKKEIGWVKQFPLKLAKAVTIHKSQGKTFSNVIVSPVIFAPGQLYVALSRVTSPRGLFLTSAIAPDAVMVDKAVQTFYKNSFSYPLENKKAKAVVHRAKKKNI
jgi:ATP-dependent DNA helicase PIF1